MDGEFKKRKRGGKEERSKGYYFQRSGGRMDTGKMKWGFEFLFFSRAAT